MDDRDCLVVAGTEVVAVVAIAVVVVAVVVVVTVIGGNAQSLL